MKYPFRAIVILCMIALLCLTAACGKTETANTAASESTAFAPVATEAPTSTAVPVTDDPMIFGDTEADDAPVIDSQPETTAAQPSGDSFDAAALTGNSWTLTGVVVGGEQQSPAVYYGSVIRQTGAYIEFSSDGSFRCVLGGAGCSGFYSVDDSGVTLHITEKFTGADEGEACDEIQPLRCDTTDGTICFDFSGATNEFTKG